MSDQFVGEIRIFPFNFAPRGWAFCDGQLLPLSQNTALFSLLGTMYGGNGESTFALPDLQGSAPLQRGQAPGLSLYDQGQTGGSESITLLGSEIPSHTHTPGARAQAANYPIPTNNVVATVAGDNLYQTNTAGLVQMAGESLAPAGGGLPHNNMMPYLTLNFCIALQGIFPPRG